MKKRISIIILTVIALMSLMSVTTFALNKTMTFKTHGDSEKLQYLSYNSDGPLVHNPITLSSATGVSGNLTVGTFGFCFDQRLGIASSSGTSGTFSRAMTNQEYSPIYYAYLSGRSYGVSGKKKYYATQVAIWAMQGSITASYSSGTPQLQVLKGDSTVLKAVKAIVEDCEESLVTPNTKKPTITVDDSKAVEKTVTYENVKCYRIGPYKVTSSTGEFKLSNNSGFTGWQQVKSGNNVYAYFKKSSTSDIVVDFKATQTKKTHISDTGVYDLGSGIQRVGYLDDNPEPVKNVSYRKEFPREEGNLKITKTDTAGVKLKGAIFDIWNDDLTVDEPFTTNASGVIELKDIPTGTYNIQEIVAPSGYEINDHTYTVKVESGKTATQTIVDTKSQARLAIVKTAANLNAYVGGAKYRIYKSNGTYTGQEITTIANNYAYSGYLPLGNYYFQESVAPTGFALDTEKHYFTLAYNNQDEFFSLEDKWLGDLSVKFIEPNVESYKVGETVMAAVYVTNNSYFNSISGAHYNDPIYGGSSTSSFTVTFSYAHYLKSTGTRYGSVKNIKEAVTVPAGGTGLAYIPIRVLTDNLYIKIEATVSSYGAVQDTNSSNDTDTLEMQISAKEETTCPNTKFENRPSSFVPPTDVLTPSVEGVKTVANAVKWSEWEYDEFDEEFKLVTYGVKFVPSITLTPKLCKSAEYDSDDEHWTMKSGYGFEVSAIGNVHSISGCSMPTYELHGNGKELSTVDTQYVPAAQGGAVFFPEFQYSTETNKYESLFGLSAINSEAVGRLQHNKYTRLENGEYPTDGYYMHYTPLWYPDGEYNVVAYMRGVWTPFGMLSGYALDSITIQGDMYDDWWLGYK